MASAKFNLVIGVSWLYTRSPRASREPFPLQRSSGSPEQLVEATRMEEGDHHRSAGSRQQAELRAIRTASCTAWFTAARKMQDRHGVTLLSILPLREK